MSRRTGIIVLLEDDAGQARAMGRVLELEGHRVLHARDAHSARRIFDEEPVIDLLIADLVLPGLSGREAANLIQAHHPGVKVLFTTGFPQSDPELKLLHSEGYPVLRKPYDAPGLVAAVDAALED